MTYPIVKIPKHITICIAVLFITFLSGCVSFEALRDINENPENMARGDPDNNKRVQAYLEAILIDPEGREVRAYHRRAYSPDNKKGLFLIHSFYVFFKDGELEHTLVFTATPKDSEMDGNWMLDAKSDLDSFNLYVDGDNPWEVEAYTDKEGTSALHFQGTVQKILERVKEEYNFFGPASVRNLPWYHLLWLSAAPPPILSLISILIISRHADNCTSAITETMQWE